MKPKTFVIIGSVMWVAFYIFVFYAAYDPNLSNIPGQEMWIIINSWHIVTALVFLTALILKVKKTLKLRSETARSLPVSTSKQTIAKKAAIFAIIGFLMFAFAAYYLTYALFHPTADIPFSLSYFTMRIIYITYLAVMGLSFLSAIVLKIVHVLKK